MYYVYIITNHTNSVLYTGITNNLERRIWQHRNKIDISSFCSKYNIYKLIWFQSFNTPTEAISIEKKIKGWKKSRKVELVKEINPYFKQLDAQS